jgi:hypothetical protein
MPPKKQDRSREIAHFAIGGEFKLGEQGTGLGV